MPDHEKKQKAARPDTDVSTGSEKGGSDEDYENRKRSATTSPTLKTNKQQKHSRGRDTITCQTSGCANRNRGTIRKSGATSTRN
jgi:hypothetical protein